MALRRPGPPAQGPLAARELAAKIPIVTRRDVYPLEQANVALGRLLEGRVAGAAVLVPG